MFLGEDGFQIANFKYFVQDCLVLFLLLLQNDSLLRQHMHNLLLLVVDQGSCPVQHLVTKSAKEQQSLPLIGHLHQLVFIVLG